MGKILNLTNWFEGNLSIAVEPVAALFTVPPQSTFRVEGTKYDLGDRLAVYFSPDAITVEIMGSEYDFFDQPRFTLDGTELDW